MFVLILSLTLNACADETVKLSYGTFKVHHHAPLEMEQAIEYCTSLSGRLPRFNNVDDFEALGAVHLAHNISYSMVRAESQKQLAILFKDVIC